MYMLFSLGRRVRDLLGLLAKLLFTSLCTSCRQALLIVASGAAVLEVSLLVVLDAWVVPREPRTRSEHQEDPYTTVAMSTTGECS